MCSGAILIRPLTGLGFFSAAGRNSTGVMGRWSTIAPPKTNSRNEVFRSGCFFYYRHTATFSLVIKFNGD
jgi:hypothetical protein